MSDNAKPHTDAHWYADTFTDFETGRSVGLVLVRQGRTLVRMGLLTRQDRTDLALVHGGGTHKVCSADDAETHALRAASERVGRTVVARSPVFWHREPGRDAWTLREGLAPRARVLLRDGRYLGVLGHTQRHYDTLKEAKEAMTQAASTQTHLGAPQG